MKPYVYMRAVRDSDLPPTARLVALTIATRADQFGHCYPSHGQLAKDTGLSVRTVIRHVQLLEEQGWLQVVRATNHRGTQANRYLCITPVDNQGEQGPEGEGGVSQSHGGGVTVSHPEGCHRVTQKKIPNEEHSANVTTDPNNPHLAAVIGAISNGMRL